MVLFLSKKCFSWWVLISLQMLDLESWIKLRGGRCISCINCIRGEGEEGDKSLDTNFHFSIFLQINHDIHVHISLFRYIFVISLSHVMIINPCTLPSPTNPLIIYPSLIKSNQPTEKMSPHFTDALWTITRYILLVCIICEMLHCTR